MTSSAAGANKKPLKGERSISGVVAGNTGRGNVVCDLDGVVYLGARGVPGAARALSTLEGDGFNLLFVTNNSSRTPLEVAERLAEVTGFSAAPGQVLTSAQAAALLLEEEHPRCFVLGGEGIRQALDEAGLEAVEDWRRAEAVVVGLATGLSYDWLRDAVSAVRSGARLVATNLDATYPSEEGLWPGAGAIVAAIETAAETTAEPCGKPFEPMRRLVRTRLGSGPVWVVGDRPDTDIAMAIAEGWRSVLVLTGVVAGAHQVPENLRPDLVVASIADLGPTLIDSA